MCGCRRADAKVATGENEHLVCPKGSRKRLGISSARNGITYATMTARRITKEMNNTWQTTTQLTSRK